MSCDHIKQNKQAEQKNNPFIGTWEIPEGSGYWQFDSTTLTQYQSRMVNGKKEEVIIKAKYTFDDTILTIVIQSLTENGVTTTIDYSLVDNFKYIIDNTSITLIQTKTNHSFTLKKK